MIDPEAAGDEDHAVGEFRRVEQIEGLGIGLAPRDRAVAGDADRTDVVPVRIIKARGGVASRRRLAMGHLLFAADLDPDAQIMRNRAGREIGPRAQLVGQNLVPRSEGRRGGKEWVWKGNIRWRRAI